MKVQTYLDVLALEPVGGERDERVLVQRQPRAQHQNGRARNLEEGEILTHHSVVMRRIKSSRQNNSYFVFKTVPLAR